MQKSRTIAFQSLCLLDLLPGLTIRFVSQAAHISSLMFVLTVFSVLLMRIPKLERAVQGVGLHPNL